jgi:DNA-binding MarR family transcriptional regulator
MSSRPEKTTTVAEAAAGFGPELSTWTILFHAAVAERLGLNTTDHKALRFIHQAGALTAGELAEQTGLTTGAITGVIDRLEQAGYVQRIRDPQDRRKVIIQPVADPRHDEELRGIFEPLVRVMDELMSRYTEQETALIFDFVQRSIAILRAETQRLRTETEQLRKTQGQASKG